MESYRKTIEKVIKETSFKIEDIFDYEFSPYKEHFNFLFEFYSEALNRNAFYGIEPNALIFINDKRINALSWKNKFSVIGINMGTVVYSLEKFNTKNNILIDTENEKYLEFEKLLDTSINDLMHAFIMHFTFYHEMAHLIQKSEIKGKTPLTYSIDEENPYTLHGHILELDSDQFASMCIGAHIFKYAIKIFKEELTIDQITMLLSIICSSGLFYLLKFRTSCNAQLACVSRCFMN